MTKKKHVVVKEKNDQMNKNRKKNDREALQGGQTHTKRFQK